MESRAIQTLIQEPRIPKIMFQSLIWQISGNDTFFSQQKNEAFHYGFLQQMLSNQYFPANFVTFTAEIINGKLCFLYSIYDY